MIVEGLPEVLQHAFRHLFFPLLLFIGLITISCSNSSIKPINKPAYEVDPFFLEFYSHSGGYDIFGPAISEATDESGVKIQYLETAKLVYDPQEKTKNLFHFAPLGKEMRVQEAPVPKPSQPETIYIEGHTVFPDFLPLYERLGANTVGKPLTEVRYHLIRSRYEQYFENLGMYRLEDSEQVKLLAYGIWACGEACPPSGEPSNAIIDLQQNIYPVFEKFVKEYGADFTGFALSEPYIRKDGRQEQIFENVVLVEQKGKGNKGVDIRPLTELVNVVPDLALEFSGKDMMYFYAIKDNKGYEVPVHFWKYIKKHGGIEIFGPPRTHYKILDEKVYHQCFLNLCLIYNQRINESARIRPEPLGYAYKTLIQVSVDIPKKTPAPTATPLLFQLKTTPQDNERREFTIQLKERFATVNPTQQQELIVIVYENDAPVEGIAPDLILLMPEEIRQTLSMKPTGKKGQSRILLPPFDAPNGTLVVYKVCLRSIPDDKLCLQDSFPIWTNP